MDTYLPYLLIFTALLAFAIGLGAGILRQRAIDEAELDQLAAENRQLRKRLAATSNTNQPSAKRIRELEASLAESDRIIEFYLGSKPDVVAGMHLYAAGADVDEYLMQDRSHQ